MESTEKRIDVMGPSVTQKVFTPGVGEYDVDPEMVYGSKMDFHEAPFSSSFGSIERTSLW